MCWDPQNINTLALITLCLSTLNQKCVIETARHHVGVKSGAVLISKAQTLQLWLNINMQVCQIKKRGCFDFFFNADDAMISIKTNMICTKFIKEITIFIHISSFFILFIFKVCL